MNWSAVAAVVSLVTLLFVILGSAFVYGKLTERVNSHSERLDQHDEKFQDHSDKIGEHDVDIAKLTQWKDGFNAGARATKDIDRM